MARPFKTSFPHSTVTELLPNWAGGQISSTAYGDHGERQRPDIVSVTRLLAFHQHLLPGGAGVLCFPLHCREIRRPVEANPITLPLFPVPVSGTEHWGGVQTGGTIGRVYGFIYHLYVVLSYS